MAMASADHLSRCGAVAVLAESQLLVIAQLIEQALAQIAASYARRVQLANHFQRFVQMFAGEVHLECGLPDASRIEAGSASRRTGSPMQLEPPEQPQPRHLADAALQTRGRRSSAPILPTTPAQEWHLRRISSISPSPSAAAAFTTLSAMAASASGEEGGATPSNSSSLAIR